MPSTARAASRRLARTGEFEAEGDGKGFEGLVVLFCEENCLFGAEAEFGGVVGGFAFKSAGAGG